ncbi:MAG TPA: aspartate/glutamate racemase family protein [Solirubrobacteraceae bacterium]|jgi:allantoin racemase|nr:aspartate/glutamate racemase family protein [Solirubrobacteraceae bacterium]
MRILVVNPNTSARMTLDIARAARQGAQPDTEILCLNPEHGPDTIEGYADEAIAAYHTVDLLAGERSGYDGYVIACFGDPAVAACRELVAAPVVGIAEASFHMACAIAHRWSVLTLLPRLKPVLEDLLLRYGVERRCASVRAVTLGVAAAAEDYERTAELLLPEARRAIAEDGAETILLGCAGLGPVAAPLSGALGVPVLDGVSCAVGLVEALVARGLSTSKANAYAAPERGPLVGASTNLQAAYAAGSEDS